MKNNLMLFLLLMSLFVWLFLIGFCEELSDLQRGVLTAFALIDSFALLKAGDN